MIPDEAVVAAVKAFRETPLLGDALMKALEAAAPHIRAESIDKAADLVASEEQHQWARDSQRLPGAQIVAQRMNVLVRILRGRATAEREVRHGND